MGASVWIRAKQLKIIRAALKVEAVKDDETAHETDKIDCHRCPKCQSLDWHYMGTSKPRQWDPG